MKSLQIGECRDCGYVVKETPDFPNTPTCECGNDLERATLATEREVEESLVDDG